MKNLIYIFILLLSALTFSQTSKVDTLKITPNNVNGFIVKEFKEKSVSEIYIALKKWAQYNINNAEFATNSDIENEYLSFKINGVGEIKYKDSDKWIWRLNLYVEARIRDNKLRLDIIVKEIDGVGQLENLSLLPSGGINSLNSLFKKNGSSRKATSTYRKDVDKSLNDFANSIFSAVEGRIDYKKTDW